MAGRNISGIQWNGGGYMNPDISPEVAAELARRGFNPDGTRMPTQSRLDGINDRISQDWQGMGFMPPQTMADPRAQYVGNNTDIFVGANSPMANTGQDPFGAETRQKVAGIKQDIDADMGKQNALIDKQNALIEALMAPEAPPAAFNDQSSKPANPYREPASAMTPPKPRMRPKPEAYTIQKGDNPSTIAKAFGMTLKELEAKNPGILKKAKRLKIGATVNL
jgi:hypothetical protein